MWVLALVQEKFHNTSPSEFYRTSIKLGASKQEEAEEMSLGWSALAPQEVRKGGLGGTAPLVASLVGSLRVSETHTGGGGSVPLGKAGFTAWLQTACLTLMFSYFSGPG